MQTEDLGTVKIFGEDRDKTGSFTIIPEEQPPKFKEWLEQAIEATAPLALPGFLQIALHEVAGWRSSVRVQVGYLWASEEGVVKSREELRMGRKKEPFRYTKLTFALKVESPPFENWHYWDDWQLVDDVDFKDDITPDNIESISCLKKGEKYIDGEELLRRAREEFHSNLGYRHAEALLPFKYKVGEVMHDYSRLLFPGTIRRDSEGNRYIPCLHYYYDKELCGKMDPDGGDYVLHLEFTPLYRKFNEFRQLVCLRKQT